jgi:hypothetical protein
MGTAVIDTTKSDETLFGSLNVMEKKRDKFGSQPSFRKSRANTLIVITKDGWDRNMSL